MRYLRVALTALVFLIGPGAMAQECTVSTGSIGFGTIDPSGQRQTTAEGRILVTCGVGKPFRITLGPGLHSVNPVSSRKMRSPGGGDYLTYNLYLDAARTRVWGDNTPGLEAHVGVGTGTKQSVIVYGRIPGNQSVAEEGYYSDSILVTVIW